MHESDLTNVPEQTAQHYVQEKMSLTVYVGDEGSYVDIDELPPFELLDLFTSHK